MAFTIYTPGSSSGVPLNIVGSLQSPADMSDTETMRDEIAGFVSGLLGLVGIDADPLSSREFILLANLIETSWTAGRSLDLATLVGLVQQPPMRKLGVFDLDAFFPPNDRTAFALRLNALLASPSFAAWAAGPPLDIGALLRSGDGKPSAAIVTVAHLSDEERQFVVALLMSKVVTWMRRQSGTTDLRTLVYMDEVAGYVPPSANPPTKKPILTLFKQARAFGVGLVLSTQNPVDLDYKAISNAGTWMVGRLQTERDKDRLLDGMSAAAGSVDVKTVGDTISALGKREFVVKRAGKDTPEVFTTRWAMSYLRGPLTRDQIAALMEGQRAAIAGSATPPAAAVTSPEGAAPAPAPASAASSTPAPASAPAPSAASAPAASAGPAPLADDETPIMPDVAQGTPIRWLDPAAAWAAQVGAAPDSTRHAAAAVARARLRYDDEKADLLVDEEWEAVLFPLTASADPGAAVAVDYDDRDLRPETPAVATYVLPAAPIGQKSFWTALQRDLVDWLVRNKTMDLFANKTLKLYSRPGEAQDAFVGRCQEAAQTKADEQAAKLRDKYRTKVSALEAKLAAAQEKASVAEAQQQAIQGQQMGSVVGSLLGSFLGGRRNTRALARSVTGGGRSSAAASARAQAAGERLAQLQQDAVELEEELKQELTAIDAEWEAKASDVQVTRVPLEKVDVAVTQVNLVWIPVTR